MCCRDVAGYDQSQSSDAQTLQGATWQSPLGIGTVAPAAGNFTTSSIGTATITTANITQLNATNVNVSSLTPNQFVATDASNNLISAGSPAGTVPATPNTLVLRDTHGDIYVNNIHPNTLLITTTGATTNLTTSTPYHILLTGILGQTLKFPNAGTAGFTVGTEFRINNGCTAGVVTVKDHGNVTIGTVPYGGLGVVILTSLAGHGTWEMHTLCGKGSTWGDNALTTGSAIVTTSPTASTSTTTGSIITSGGVGIQGNVWIGGTLNVAGGMTGIPITAMFWQLAATKEVGNVFSLIQNSGYSSTGSLYMYQYYQNPAAINDQWSQQFTMASGSYALNVLGYTAPDRGIITWYIDGVSQGGTDFYESPGLANAIKTINVTITTTGTHTIRGILSTKNAGSAGYYCTIVQYWIK